LSVALLQTSMVHLSSRITITGGAGFLGRHFVRRLADAGYRNLFVPRSAEYDLRRAADVARMLEVARPNVVVHLAAVVGGIGANRDHPGAFFYDNVIIGVELMEQARRAGVEKFVAVGTVCGYPRNPPLPFREDDFWEGYPEETNAAYGIAKKVLLVQAQSYRREFGFDAIYLVPVNLYGPGDSFDPLRSHVVPALIRKCIEATESGAGEIEVWGTGSASRELLYVDDCARALQLAMERYDGAEPVNVGSGEEITIRELVAEIAALTGYRGAIRWDASKPDGQPRRRLEVSRAEAEFGFRATTPLRDGLIRTIEWYRRRRTASEGGA
jgi:GDP-L-fucose synthase